MANPRRAATIRTSIAAMQADFGPKITHYNSPLDKPRLYRWSVGATDTIDNVTVLGHNGGTPGRWFLVRDDTKGADLTDNDETIAVGDNFFRVLPAATPLTAQRVKTLSPTNAAAGDIVHILRQGLGAFDMLIDNGGPAAGTIFTLPASQSWWARVYFDGANWIAHSAGQLP